MKCTSVQISYTARDLRCVFIGILENTCCQQDQKRRRVRARQREGSITRDLSGLATWWGQDQGGTLPKN